MSKITKQMFLECYEEYRKGNLNHVPEGMNANSAKMIMLWTDSLFTGEPYHRNGSVLQYRIILERILNDYGTRQTSKAIAVLLEHCNWSFEKYGKQMKKHREVKSFSPTSVTLKLN